MALSRADEADLFRIGWMLDWLKLKLELVKIEIALKAYNPNQPRVPAGNGDESGRWTRVDGWTQVASNTRRPGGGATSGYPFQGGGPARFPGASLRQQTELQSATLAAQAAIARVRERDPSWRPGSHVYETIEGAIRARNAEAREADQRLSDLRFEAATQKRPGSEFIRTESAGPLNAAQQREINQLGARNGCSTCGRSDSGTKTGNWVGDHQLPNALNPPGRMQRVFPHCAGCSSSQGGIVRNIIRHQKGKQ